MALREHVSLYRRYLDDRLMSKETFKNYYIIMEGTNTEPIYFNLLEKKLMDLRIHNNIKLVIIERTLRDRGSNSPGQLMNFIKAYKEKNNDPDGKYFIIFDRDSYKSHSHPKEAYLTFIKNNKNKNINMLLTSPCFEIWLLLHKDNAYQDIIEPKKDEIFVNKRISPTYTYISKLVKDVFGYNPKATIPTNFLDNLDFALKEAKYLTKNIEDMADEIGENISPFIQELLSDPRN